MPQPAWPLIGSIFQGFTTLGIALLVAWVALQQWRTARDKLALDLFDRRFALYQRLVDTAEHHHKALMHDPAPVDASNWADFYRAHGEAFWLFGDDFLKELMRLEGALLTMAEIHNELAHENRADFLTDLRFAEFNAIYYRSLRGIDRLSHVYMRFGHVAANSKAPKVMF